MGADTLDAQWAPLAEKIAELVDARLRAAPPPPDREYFDIADAARITGVSEKALRNHVTEGTSPRVSRPRGSTRMIRFHIDDLHAWMERRQHGRDPA